MGNAKKAPKFAVMKKLISSKTLWKYKEEVLNPKKKHTEIDKLPRNVNELVRSTPNACHIDRDAASDLADDNLTNSLNNVISEEQASSLAFSYEEDRQHDEVAELVDSEDELGTIAPKGPRRKKKMFIDIEDDD